MFIESYRDRITEVEAAGPFHHGEADGPFRIAVEEGLGKACIFGTEDEEVVGGVGDVGVELRCLGGEEPKGFVLEVGGQVGGFFDVNTEPVVEAGPFEGAVGGVKTDRFDEGEGGACAGAGADDVAGVGGDLRFKKDDAHGLHLSDVGDGEEAELCGAERSGDRLCTALTLIGVEGAKEG